MPQLQFDAKITSKDGTMIMYVRGPVQMEGGTGYQFKVLPVADMRNWAQIWKEEEVEDEAGASSD